MRINKGYVERLALKLNKWEKTVHVCQRNNYWAVDSPQGYECYNCGMTTRECYLFLKGMLTGIQLAKEEIELSEFKGEL